MNTRRNFLTALAAFPFLGWLKPVEGVPLGGVVEGYDPSTKVATTTGVDLKLDEHGYHYWCGGVWVGFTPHCELPPS